MSAAPAVIDRMFIAGRSIARCSRHDALHL
jgi:hypothetical protein